MAQRSLPTPTTLRVRSTGGMCVAPHVPVEVASTSALTTVAARGRPRRKKLKWRTRDSQSSRLYNLQLDIQDVQQQIRALNEYRALLAARTLNRQDDLDGRYVKTVMEYHRVFEHGYHPLGRGNANAAQPMVDARQFVLCMMDDNLRIGRYAGLDVLLDQWERYTRAMTGLDFRYTSSRVIPHDGCTTVISRATYSHLIARDMIESMFPQLLRDHPDIVTKLLGSVVQGEGEYEFTFDSRTHRVVHFEFRLDYMEVFAKLLRDVRELSAVFTGASISEESLIGDIEAYDAYRRDSNTMEVSRGHDEQCDLQEQEESTRQVVDDPAQYPPYRDGFSVATLLAPASEEQVNSKSDLPPLVRPPSTYTS